MVEELKKFVRYVKKQGQFFLVTFFVVSVLAAVDFIFNVSIVEDLLVLVKEFYAKWGLLFIFVASMIEGALFINWYFPGSTIVLIGALLARAGLMPFWSLGVVAYLGFLFAFLFDYVLGRYGFHKILIRWGPFSERVDAGARALQKRAISTFFIWYFHPQSGNFVATAAGVLHYPFFKFFALNAGALFFWISFWLGLVYIFGSIILYIIDNYFAVFILLALSAWLITGYIKERKSLQ
jgi:membrane protein DedA with SNARE-associated domain